MRFVIEDVKHTTMAFVCFCSLSDLYQLEIPLKQKIWSSSVDIWRQHFLEQWFQPGNWGNGVKVVEHQKLSIKEVARLFFLSGLWKHWLQQQQTVHNNWLFGGKDLVRWQNWFVAANSASSKPTESAVSFWIFAEFIAMILYITINQHLAWWADLNSELLARWRPQVLAMGPSARYSWTCAKNVKHSQKFPIILGGHLYENAFNASSKDEALHT
jgi:hypothetical protein